MSSRGRILILLVLLLGVAYLFSGSYLGEKPENTVQTSPLLSGNQPITIGQTHYLFDIANHKPHEIKTLLERAEMLSKEVKTSDHKTRIAMVIHGPDIEVFDQKNYEQNKEIIDLAARLDASDIIDFKVCKRTAKERGIDTSNFPSFIEIIPFAGDELQRLKTEGYTEIF